MRSTSAAKSPRAHRGTSWRNCRTMLLNSQPIDNHVFQKLKAGPQARAGKAAHARVPNGLHLIDRHLETEALDDEFRLQEPIARGELELFRRLTRHEARRAVDIAIRAPEKRLEYQIVRRALNEPKD